jgi:DNA-binding transcriptional regulator YdaS (Cro superfamily)
MHELAPSPSGIADAIVAAGTQAELAATLGVTQQVVSRWLRRGWVPLRRANQIEERFRIPRGRLANPKLMALLVPGASTAAPHG